MATATLPNSAAPSTAKTTTERFDKAFGIQTTTKKDEAGNEVKKREVVMLDPEEAEKLEKEGAFEGQIVTVSTDYPLTFDALVAFVGSPQYDDDGKQRDQSEVGDEAAKLFKSGAKVKVMNRLRAILTKTDSDGNLTFSDDQLTNGVLDLTKEILSGSKRIMLSEEEKTWKSLSNLPDAVRRSMYDVYLQSRGQQPGNYPASE